ncbi:MAG: 3-isopropylmalate dehydratase small subunit [Gemmatimonadaceae bacterium]|nr:3-isopropylmalate dehydratase small subunit [Gemmatimonadaceae bacterium]
MSQAWTPLRSHAVPLQRDDIDTDQIIPARFLTTTTRSGLGTNLFSDWRYDADRAPVPGFVLNTPASAGAQVLVAGRNFGCGSSREHAPWALSDWGFRAVIASSFADIFRSNAHKNGLLTIALDTPVLRTLHEALARDRSAEITVDLPNQLVHLPGGVSAAFTIDPFSKRCLIDGLDELGALLADLPAIEAWEATCAR